MPKTKNKFEVDMGYANIAESVESRDTTPIHAFAFKYGIPHGIANKFIGKTEQETDENIQIISKAIDKYAEKYESGAIKSKDGDGNRMNIWNAPYGYKRGCNGAFIENESEQTVIRFIMKLRKNDMLIMDICKELKANGYKTRKGNENWQTSVVSRVIERERHKYKE